MASLGTQPEFAKHMYNARASNYDDSWHPTFAKFMADSLGLKPGEKLLDLACGTGLVALPAAQQLGPSGEAVGVDISDGMLQELHAKLNANENQYLHVRIYNHDITKLDEIEELQKGHFDAISCASALVLLQEPAVALQRWSEYLKPGGRLITDSTDINNLPFGTALERVFQRLGVESPHNRLWAVDGSSLQRVLWQAGLEVDKIWFKAPAGKGPEYHDISEAEERFDVIANGPLNKSLVDHGLLDQAKPLFIEEWKKLANDEGKILESNGVWCGLAYKPLEAKVYGKGSCACGAIKWTAFAPAGPSANCHCSICRKISGSPYVTFIEFPVNKIIFDPPLGKPHLKISKLTPYAERGFCRECGSTMTMEYVGDMESGVTYIAAGSIDEEQSEAGFYNGPGRHIYAGSVPEWYKFPEDGLERQSKMKGADRLLVDRTK